MVGNKIVPFSASPSDGESRCDISVIINAHREGLLCIPSIHSAEVAARKARALDLSVELIVALDCADDSTREIIQAFKKKQIIDIILDLQVDDLGSARNKSAEEARGKWIAFLDADDLWDSDWLVAAHQRAESESRLVVWHPELNIYFGEQWRIFPHIDMDDPYFSIARLAIRNFWTSSCFTRRSLVTSVPYPRTDLLNQVGYEDWNWNLRTIDNGAVHKIVSGTSHGIRVRSRSLGQRTIERAAMPAPSLLFRRILAARTVGSPDLSVHD